MTPSPWTPVSEPPPHAGPWLVTNGDYQAVALFVRESWFAEFGGDRLRITHWMPLPELPK